MIAAGGRLGLLAPIARDLDVGVSTAAQLISAYAIAFAVGARLCRCGGSQSKPGSHARIGFSSG